MKILGLSDFGVPTGFGRIANETFRRLFLRKHQILGASIYWDGMHPHDLPFWVFSLAGHDIWTYFSSIVAEHKPDVVVIIQDFPYAQQFYQGTRSDFSKFKFVIVTPIDGTPIGNDWLEMVDVADANLVISRFGVEAMRNSGRSVGLLHPGVDTNEFFPIPKNELRKKAGIPEDAFVLGTMGVNQGRKAFEFMTQIFLEFARDKKDAWYFLDCDKHGVAGWNLPALFNELVKYHRLDPKILDRVLYKEDLLKFGFIELRERYNLLDVHMVLSHREGFGLPLLEAQACGVCSMAMDWCSGTEICGDDKGLLVKPVVNPYPRFGAWGNAIDKDPDVEDAIVKLDEVYYNRERLKLLARNGYDWAIKQTWDVATDQLEVALKRAVERPVFIRPRNEFIVIPPLPKAAGLTDMNQIAWSQPDSTVGGGVLGDSPLRTEVIDD